MSSDDFLRNKILSSTVPMSLCLYKHVFLWFSTFLNEHFKLQWGKRLIQMHSVINLRFSEVKEGRLPPSTISLSSLWALLKSTLTLTSAMALLFSGQPLGCERTAFLCQTHSLYPPLHCYSSSTSAQSHCRDNLSSVSWYCIRRLMQTLDIQPKL